MESYKEFCEGWIGGANGSRPYQRNELFTEDRLEEQYDQIKKAQECNRKRGAIVTDYQLQLFGTVSGK